MGRNQPIQDFASRGEGMEGSHLIGSHEAAIAFNVSRKDSSQTALRFDGLSQANPGAYGFRGGILICSG
jgi:hypothetical protein